MKKIVVTSEFKVCENCLVEKNLDRFYKYKSGSPARLCKDCKNAESKTNYYANIDRRKETSRAWLESDRGKSITAAYRKSERGKAAFKRGADAYAKRYPVKNAAQTMLGNAVQAGKIKRLPCEVCGADKAHGHHDDYSKPLDVRWLCRKHHVDWHRHNKAKSPDDILEKIV